MKTLTSPRLLRRVAADERVRVVIPTWALLAVSVMLLCGLSTAQQAASQSRIDKEERALMDQVTLAPEQIESVLRTQPLMMLNVKRALVRKAYEQGRLLDPADLTDTVVLQLVQEDRNVQIVATHEIERSLSTVESYPTQRSSSDQ